LLYGSDAQIAEHAAQLGVEVAALMPLTSPTEGGSDSSDSGLNIPDFDFDPDNLQLPLFPGGAPDLPDQLDPGQRARLCDVLGYVHERLRDVSFDGAECDDPSPNAWLQVPWSHWQNMLQLQQDLAAYLRKIADLDEL